MLNLNSLYGKRFDERKVCVLLMKADPSVDKAVSLGEDNVCEGSVCHKEGSSDYG
jgi:hypothetical protein